MFFVSAMCTKAWGRCYIRVGWFVDEEFRQALDGALDEIRRREPEYFRRRAVRARPISAKCLELVELPLLDGIGADELSGALEQAKLHWSRQGVVFTSSEQGDPVAEMLFGSAADALAMTRGRLSRRPSSPGESSVERVVARDFDERKTPANVRYLVARHGTRPLVLISAKGIPLEIWSRFLSDPPRPFRVIVVESRSSDVFSGGLRDQTDVAEDARDIVDVLQHESIAEADFLAWCNGARVAIEVCASHASKVRALALLTPTVDGFRGVEQRGSEFEDNLAMLLRSVAKRPQLAPMVIETFKARFEAQPGSAETDATSDAGWLFNLPAKEHAKLLNAPLADAMSLLNYARCSAADASFAINDALLRVRAPTLLITGSDDRVVNNELSVAALGWARKRASHVAISGAGHYINGLQHRYLVWILEEWLNRPSTPTSLARARATEIVPPN